MKKSFYFDTWWFEYVIVPRDETLAEDKIIEHVSLSLKSKKDYLCSLFLDFLF